MSATFTRCLPNLPTTTATIVRIASWSYGAPLSGPRNPLAAWSRVQCSAAFTMCTLVPREGRCIFVALQHFRLATQPHPQLAEAPHPRNRSRNPRDLAGHARRLASYRTPEGIRSLRLQDPSP
jgi:hypothetical protein